MDFNEYQQLTKSTAIYPESGKRTPNGINYCTLGLIGEAGELANAWKKTIRDPKDAAMFKEKMRYEIGDVLWYLARLADEMGMKLEDVAVSNLDKLRERSNRGRIAGFGDER